MQKTQEGRLSQNRGDRVSHMKERQGDEAKLAWEFGKKIGLASDIPETEVFEAFGGMDKLARDESGLGNGGSGNVLNENA